VTSYRILTQKLALSAASASTQHNTALALSIVIWLSAGDGQSAAGRRVFREVAPIHREPSGKMSPLGAVID
jgi:hypothetical protein